MNIPFWDDRVTVSFFFFVNRDPLLLYHNWLNWLISLFAASIDELRGGVSLWELINKPSFSDDKNPEPRKLFVFFFFVFDYHGEQNNYAPCSSTGLTITGNLIFIGESYCKLYRPYSDHSFT